MKNILKFILSKYHKFWTPVVIAGLGLFFYALRFFDNPIREIIPHLAAIATVLLVIAFVMLVMGVAVDWTNTGYRANDASVQDVDESQAANGKKPPSPTT